jgi:hypothetical protein
MGPRPAASDLKSSELTTSGDRSPGKYSPKAQVEGVGWVVLHRDDAEPAEDVEAGVVGGPQGDAVLSALVATSGRAQ